MREENAIEVNSISKSFKVYYDRGNTIKEQVVSSKRRKYENRHVLNDISFDVKKGEALGLIGKNGCGKSTLLKLLTKIIYPDNGSIEIRGRVSSLLELGAGFHPDMSGRENIYINASIFGLTKKEIDARLEDIIAFSELGEYIDNPVRTYSSGMYMRLAFSVAINVNADVLLIDEILAVGDANFQAKCFAWIKRMKKQGTTIVIVSHSLGQIEQICDRTIWLQDGRIKLEGKPYKVHPEYLDFMQEKYREIQEDELDRQNRKEKKEEEQNHSQENTDEAAEKTDVAKAEKQKDRWGNGDVIIEKVSLLNDKGEEKNVYSVGESMEIKIAYRVVKPLEMPNIGIAVKREDEINCYGTNCAIDRVNIPVLDKSGECSVVIESCCLLTGRYTIDVAISSPNGFDCDYILKVQKFTMISNKAEQGVVRMPHRWYLNGENIH